MTRGRTWAANAGSVRAAFPGMSKSKVHDLPAVWTPIALWATRRASRSALGLNPPTSRPNKAAGRIPWTRRGLVGAPALFNCLRRTKRPRTLASRILRYLPREALAHEKSTPRFLASAATTVMEGMRRTTSLDTAALDVVSTCFPGWRTSPATCWSSWHATA